MKVRNDSQCEKITKVLCYSVFSILRLIPRKSRVNMDSLAGEKCELSA